MSFSVVCMVNYTAIAVVGDAVEGVGVNTTITVAWSNGSTRAPGNSSRPAYHIKSNGSSSSSSDSSGQCGTKAAEAAADSYQVSCI